MAENYSFFNSKDHDRVYNARHWADYFFPLFKSGVFNGDLQVVANGGMTVKIKSGYAWIDGYGYHLTDGLVVDLETASGNMNRTDSIVIRLDLTNRWIKAFCKTGSYYAGAGVPPAPEITATIHEIVISHISVAAGVTEITQDMITDTRMDGNICGWVCGAVDQIDFSQITAQFESFFNNYRQEIAEAFKEFSDDATLKYQTYSDNVDGYDAQAQEKLAETKRQFIEYTNEQERTWEAWTEKEKQETDAWQQAQEESFSLWYNQKTGTWEADWETWFAHVKDQLSGDTAGNLQNQIDSNAAQLRTHDEQIQEALKLIGIESRSLTATQSDVLLMAMALSTITDADVLDSKNAAVETLENAEDVIIAYGVYDAENKRICA